MRAVVVLPTPRTPVRTQACGIRPVSNALDSVRTIASWPMRSSKDAGRYLRANTRYGEAVASFISWPQQILASAYLGPQRSRQGTWSGRLTSDPNRGSLGLLPSGPDPVGEWFVHRQPPAPYIDGTHRDCKRRAEGREFRVCAGFLTSRGALEGSPPPAGPPAAGPPAAGPPAAKPPI